MKNKTLYILKRYNVAFRVIGALVLTFGVIKMLGLSRTNEYFLMLVVYIAMFSLIAIAKKYYSKRRLKYSLCFSVPFSVALWLGRKITDGGRVFQGFSLLDILVVVSIIVIVCLISIFLLGVIDKHSFVIKDNKVKTKWLKYSLIVFLCWVPLFLAFFPGIVSNDTAVQIRQAIGEGEWTNWHPVAHTAFMALPITIGFNIFGDLTAGIALATITQMIVLSLILGYTIDWIISKTGKIWVGWLLLLFYAFCPIVSCYSIILWKDVIFSALILLLVIKVLDLMIKEQRNDIIGLNNLIIVFVVATGVAFFRNGGFLIVLMITISLFVYYKNCRKKIILIGLMSLIAVFVIQGPIYSLIGIKKSPFVESLSVMVQQVGYVVAHDELSGEERDALSKYVVIDELSKQYDPFNADPAKNSTYYEVVEENKVGFISLWFKMFWSHIGSYIKAYILQTYSYWYPESISWSITLEHNHEDVWLTEDYNDLSLIGNDARDLIRKIEYGIMNTSWLGWISSVGLMFWSIIYLVIVFLYQKKYYILVSMSCILVYMISLLVASPVSGMFRYVFSLLLCMPVLIVFCFCNIKKGEKK